jgi:hypothetical protein
LTEGTRAAHEANTAPWGFTATGVAPLGGVEHQQSRQAAPTPSLEPHEREPPQYQSAPPLGADFDFWHK